MPNSGAKMFIRQKPSDFRAFGIALFAYFMREKSHAWRAHRIYRRYNDPGNYVHLPIIHILVFDGKILCESYFMYTKLNAVKMWY